jgi:hypothetical protein
MMTEAEKKAHCLKVMADIKPELDKFEAGEATRIAAGRPRHLIHKSLRSEFSTLEKMVKLFKV